MKRKTVHNERLRLRRDHPDVIAAWSMGLVFTTEISGSYFIGDRDVTKIIRDLVKYSVIPIEWPK